MKHPYAKYKTAEIERRCDFLCETSKEIMYEMAEYCEERKLPFLVTDSVSTAEEDFKLNRVSSTHRTARAFDISIHGWISIAVSTFENYFERRFVSAAAVNKLGEPKLIVRHDNGNGDHIHVQVARIFSVEKPLG